MKSMLNYGGLWPARDLELHHHHNMNNWCTILGHVLQLWRAFCGLLQLQMMFLIVVTKQQSVARRATADCATHLAQGATARASGQASNHTLRYPAIFHSQDILTAIFTNVACSMAGSIEDSRHGMANNSDECPTCFMRNSFNDFEDDNCCATCW